MSKLEELIEQYCPDGVEWKALGELGQFYSGLSGKTKSDFTGGNEKFITYVNVFNNPSLKTDVPERVKIAEGEKQNTIQYGDILFTGSSETPDECGMSSVLTHAIEEKLYLNSFCFGFRFFDLSDKCPSFMKYLFRSTNIRKTICKTANGVTRYNISKKEFAKIEIPIIPLPVQEEIVRILDNFTELQAELQAELQKRLQQYEYYKWNIFEGLSCPTKHITDVALVKARVGWQRLTTAEYQETGDYYLITGTDFKNGKIDFNSCVFVSKERYEMDPNIIVCKGDILITKDGTLGKVAFMAEEPNKPTTLNSGVFRIHTTDLQVSSRYLFHYFTSKYFTDFVNSVKTGSTIPHLTQQGLVSLNIPIPSLEEQNRVVSILDRFDSLTNDLTAGLPAEIEKRRQQYEYYRDKLLTFKRKGA